MNESEGTQLPEPVRGTHIIDVRRRAQQHQHGYTVDGDIGRSGDLAMAAGCLAIAVGHVLNFGPNAVSAAREIALEQWPWDEASFDRAFDEDLIHSLGNAGALIAASIDAKLRQLVDSLNSASAFASSVDPEFEEPADLSPEQAASLNSFVQQMDNHSWLDDLLKDEDKNS